MSLLFKRLCAAAARRGVARTTRCLYFVTRPASVGWKSVVRVHDGHAQRAKADVEARVADYDRSVKAIQSKIEAGID